MVSRVDVTFYDTYAYTGEVPSIQLNKDTFYGVGVMPCIAVFTAGIKHSKDHKCKFINFEDDGFEVKKHIGLVW